MPLQQRILDEEKVLSSNVRDILSEWKDARDTNLMGADVVPKEALRTVNAFQARAAQLREDCARLSKALSSLNLNLELTNELEPLEKEMSGFEDVWKSLGSVWESVSEVRELLWTAAVPRKVRATLSKIVKDMESMSRRIQQYEAHQQLRGRIKGYTMSMKLLSELKSSALKDRHWKKIVKLIGVSHISMMQLTLGDLLDARPKSREKD